ncbi:hypothetical protein [Bradyrhizobium sp. 25ACV]
MTTAASRHGPEIVEHQRRGDGERNQSHRRLAREQPKQQGHAASELDRNRARGENGP